MTRMTVAFDTLKLARRLNVASQADIRAVQADIRELEVKLRAEIGETELRLRADIANVRMQSQRAEMIRWVVGVGVAAVIAVGGMILTATIALLRALPHT